MDGPFDFSGPSEERLKAVEDLYKKQMHNFIHGLFDKEEMLQNAVMAMAMIQVNKIFDYEIDDAVKPEFIDTLAERVKEMTKNPVQLTALLTCIKVGSMAMISCLPLSVRPRSSALTSDSTSSTRRPHPSSREPIMSMLALSFSMLTRKVLRSSLCSVKSSWRSRRSSLRSSSCDRRSR